MSSCKHRCRPSEQPSLNLRLTGTEATAVARHGTGRLDMADGEMYEGAWKLGRRHGTGELPLHWCMP